MTPRCQPAIARDSLETVERTADVFYGIIVAGPMLNVIPKEDKLKLYGLTPDDLQSQTETWLGGLVVGSVPEKEQLTDIRLIFSLNNKTSLEKRSLTLYRTSP